MNYVYFTYRATSENVYIHKYLCTTWHRISPCCLLRMPCPSLEMSSVKFAFNISCKMETHFTPDICQVLDTYLPNYATLWIAFSLQHHTITSPLTSVQTDRHSFRPPAVCHVVQWILTQKMNLSIERNVFTTKVSGCWKCKCMRIIFIWYT